MCCCKAFIDKERQALSLNGLSPQSYYHLEGTCPWGGQGFEIDKHPGRSLSPRPSKIWWIRPGQRPLRTVVGPLTVAGIEELNQDYLRARETLFAEMGLGQPDSA